MPHQKEEEIFASARARGSWWDPGTGKSRGFLGHLDRLAEMQAIDSVIVLAPKGVHSNWTRHELPKHVSPGSLVAHAWSTDDAGKAKHDDSARRLLDASERRPSFLAISYDSMMTDAGHDFMRALIKAKPRVLLGADEIQRVKTPGAKRSMRTMALSKKAHFSRAMTASLVDNSPFDAYNPLRVLDPDAWQGIGCSNFAAFKAYFGVWEQIQRGPRSYPKLTKYRNERTLQEIIARYGRRIEKAAVLSLPEKRRGRVYSKMEPAQRKVYDELKKQLFTILPDGSMVSCQQAIVLMTRLSQVAAGYVPDDDERRIRFLVDPNPRVQLTIDTIEDYPGQKIIFSRFTPDVDALLKELARRGKSAVRYDGLVNDKDRVDALVAMEQGDAEYFVSKPECGGVGLNLTMAETVSYHTIGFSYEGRRQSEDRAHRYGQEKVVSYIDTLAEDSIDEYVMQKLNQKKSVSGDLMGDSDLSLI